MTADNLSTHDTACPCAPCQRDPYVDPAGPAVPGPGQEDYSAVMSAREVLAESVIQYADDIGLQLQPWQAEVIRSLYGGQLVTRSRRNGMATVRQLIEEHSAQRTDGDACGLYNAQSVTKSAESSVLPS